MSVNRKTSSAQRIGDLDTRRVTRTCPHHGDYETEVLVDIDSGEQLLQRSACPQCRRLQEAQRQEEEAQARAAEQALRLQQLLAGAGVPPRYREKRLDNFVLSDNPGTRAKQRLVLGTVSDYAETFPDRLADGGCLVLEGGVGTGKTHLCTGLVYSVIRNHGCSAIYTGVLKLMAAVKDGYEKRQSANALAPYLNADLLVIDEVGMQHDTSHERVILTDIINTRYENMKSTVIASNLMGDALENFIGARIVDRSREGGGATLTLDWESYR